MVSLKNTHRVPTKNARCFSRIRILSRQKTLGVSKEYAYRVSKSTHKVSSEYAWFLCQLGMMSLKNTHGISEEYAWGLYVHCQNSTLFSVQTANLLYILSLYVLPCATHAAKVHYILRHSVTLYEQLFLQRQKMSLCAVRIFGLPWAKTPSPFCGVSQFVGDWPKHFGSQLRSFFWVHS